MNLARRIPRSRLMQKPFITVLSQFVHASIGAYAFLAALGFLGSEVIAIDESLQLLGGREVLEGRLPHRDFWSMYPALNYYLNGLAFRAWGPSFMVARLVTVFIYGVTVVALSRYVLSSLKTQPAPLRWMTLAASVFCLTRVLQLSQNNTILCAILVIMYCLSKLERSIRFARRALIICGTASGLLVAMRLNLGLYLIASIAACVVVTGESARPRALLERLPTLLPLILPFFVTCLLLLLPFGAFAKDVIKQIARTPNLVLRAGHMVDVSNIATPYFCFLAVVGFTLLACRVDWSNRRERVVAVSLSAISLGLASLALRVLSAQHLLLVPYVIPALLIGVLIVTQLAWRRFTPSVFLSLFFLLANLQHYLIRADGLHLYILGAAVAVVIASSIASQPQRWRLAGMALLFWLMAEFPLPINHDGIAQWLWPVNPKAIMPALRVISSAHSYLALGDSARLTNGEPLLPFERRFFPDRDEQSVANYVNRFAAPQDAVFMGLTSHDQTRVNDARLSWIMPRRLASRYLELEPGVITAEPVQREIVQSLRAGVHWLVLQDTASTGTARYPFPRSTFLDRYIAANYRRAVSFGKLHVYCRFDACPSP